jgi:hypothetical protein
MKPELQLQVSYLKTAELSGEHHLVTEGRLTTLLNATCYMVQNVSSALPSPLDDAINAMDQFEGCLADIDRLVVDDEDPFNVYISAPKTTIRDDQLLTW